MAIEKIAFHGSGKVGSETFDTVRWEERFRAAAVAAGYRVELVTRNVARQRLCHGNYANDKYVRLALVERFGRKETRGLNVHTQAALAVALTGVCG